MGAGLQARNSIRVLKIQNPEAQRADREKYEHERSMRLLEEKRQQYADFITAYENFEEVADNIPERGQRSPEEMEEIGRVEDELAASFARLYFIASPSVFEAADRIFMRLIQDVKVWGPTRSYFVEAARKDLGVGGTLPRNWTAAREPPDDLDQDDP